MKKSLLLVMLFFGMAVFISPPVQAEIIYMQGSLYYGTEPADETKLYLDLDSQMSQEIYEGAEYYYWDSDDSGASSDATCQ